jgi:hypothetical protein
VFKDSQEILKRYPTHVLATVSERAASAKFENWEHLLERATSGVEYRPDTNMN